MTELEIKENKFYVLRIKGKDEEKLTLHSEIDSPIKRIRSSLKSGIKPDNIELLSVEIKGENFEIKGVPWSVIAAELVKES